MHIVGSETVRNTLGVFFILWSVYDIDQSGPRCFTAVFAEVKRVEVGSFYFRKCRTHVLAFAQHYLSFELSRMYLRHHLRFAIYRSIGIILTIIQAFHRRKPVFQIVAFRTPDIDVSVIRLSSAIASVISLIHLANFSRILSRHRGLRASDDSISLSVLYFPIRCEIGGRKEREREREREPEEETRGKTSFPRAAAPCCFHTVEYEMH